MIIRRQVLFAFAVPAALASPAAFAQSAAAERESALREAIGLYVSAWNRRDADALSALLTDDVHYIDPYGVEKRTREVVAAYSKTVMAVYELRLDVVRLRIDSNGRDATVVLRGQHLGLPVRDGKYSQVFDRAPLLSRWRFEGGTWRLYYFIDSTVRSGELVKAEGLE